MFVNIILKEKRKVKFNSRVIRFRKRGTKKNFLFEIVVMWKKSRRQSSFIDKLGFFDPSIKRKLFYLDSYKLAFWLTKGCLLSRNFIKLLSFMLVNKNIKLNFNNYRNNFFLDNRLSLNDNNIIKLNSFLQKNLIDFFIFKYTLNKIYL